MPMMDSRFSTRAASSALPGVSRVNASRADVVFTQAPSSPSSRSARTRCSVRWVVLSAGLAAAMALTGCGDSKLKKQIVRGCEAQGAPASVCGCVADKILAQYSEDELKAMFIQEDRQKLGRYFDDLIRAARTCSS